MSFNCANLHPYNEADNGVVHVIDGVAAPKPPLVGQNGGYVAGTVRRCKLDPSLKAPPGFKGST